MEYLQALETELDTLNSSPCQDKGSSEFMELILKIHQRIEVTCPDALVFPIFNGEEWISVSNAIEAIQHVMSCPHRNGGHGCGIGCYD